MASQCVLTRRQLNCWRPARAAAAPRPKGARPGEGGRAARRPAGAVDDGPVPLALDTPRGIRARPTGCALELGRLVKAIIQRGTLHIVMLSGLLGVRLPRAASWRHVWPPSYETCLPTARLEEARCRRSPVELEGVELTFKQVPGDARALREARGWPATFIPAGFRATRTSCTPRHQGSGGTAATACTRLRRGRSPGARPPEEAFDQLVRSYLAAYARRRSTTSAAGRIPRLAPLTASLERQSLRTFRDEQGTLRSTTCRGHRSPMPTAPAPCD